MFKDNPLLMQLKSGMTAEAIEEPTSKVEGEVRGTRQAFGFLQTDDDQSFFIAPPQMRHCMPGDRVTANIVLQDNGKTEAIIESIIKPVSGTFIGVVRFRGQRPFIIPEDPAFKNSFAIPTIKRDRERDGDIVIANILKHPFETGSAQAEIVEIVANERDRQAFWRAACARHNISFEPPVFNQEDIPLDSTSFSGHKNLRHVPFVTIDGESTRDIDDAVHASKLEDGRINLMVAIADPERFIAEGSATEKDAYSRGFTTYLPGISISMIPKVLSEQGASLMEGEDRHVLCCNMLIDLNGSIESYDFFLGVIRSHAKLSYDTVQSFIDGEATDLDDTVKQGLLTLNEVCNRRGEWRAANAITSARYSDFRFVVEDFELKEVCISEQTRAMKLIEESMVAANLSFALFMNEHKLPCVYRRHDGFKLDRIDELVALLAEHGITTTTLSLQTMEGFRALMLEVAARDSSELDLAMRGFMERGRHDMVFAPHFAQGHKGYATFTSPIRKYGDLINHRSIKNFLLGTGKKVTLTQEMIAHLDDRIFETDRASMDVQRDLYVRLYEPKIGTVSKGRVVGIMKAGARVELEDTGASVFIATRSLGRKGDVFTVSANGLDLSRNGNPLIKLGETMDVLIASVDVQGRSINGAPNPAR